ncbi:DMT family transporter [Halopenitus persicus]|uniref:DMT family transporter n=1 Tax=Halopenitus persicus TaxID=1048396 RepID=UPI000BBA7DB4|nr:DMT family transporter [Halopenitus persicus]
MELLALAGLLFAALAAVLWAVHNVIVRVATRTGTVADTLAVVLAVNVLCLVPFSAVAYYPDYGLTPVSTGAFAAAGLAGLLLGRLCMFEAITAIGASRTTPVVSASTLVSTGLAVWLLGETITARHLVGICCIVAGVAVISWLTATDAGDDDSLRGIGVSLLLPLAAAAFIGIEPVLIRVGLTAGTPIPVGLSVMIAAASVSYLGYRRVRDGAISLPRHGEGPRWYVWAGLSSSAGLIAYFAALSVAPVVIVIPIVQVSPLVVLVISAAFLPRRVERVTLRLVLAAAVVVVGAALVSLSG